MYVANLVITRKAIDGLIANWADCWGAVGLLLGLGWLGWLVGWAYLSSHVSYPAAGGRCGGEGNGKKGGKEGEKSGKKGKKRGKKGQSRWTRWILEGKKKAGQL